MRLLPRSPVKIVLEEAISESSRELVFPAADGSIADRRDTPASCEAGRWAALGWCVDTSTSAAVRLWTRRGGQNAELRHCPIRASRASFPATEGSRRMEHPRSWGEVRGGCDGPKPFLYPADAQQRRAAWRGSAPTSLLPGRRAAE